MTQLLYELLLQADFSSMANASLAGNTSAATENDKATQITTIEIEEKLSS